MSKIITAKEAHRIFVETTVTPEFISRKIKDAAETRSEFTLFSDLTAEQFEELKSLGFKVSYAGKYVAVSWREEV